jgi:hypothetical protein
MTTLILATPARASQPARPSRWPAGTLAAAGTIPELTMNAHATLALSQGHHPANHRSAIPTRVYESGSGHGHDAAPAGHPHPPRPPPPAAHARPPHYRLPATRVQGACGVASERSAPLDPGHRSRDRGSYQDMGSDRHAPLPHTKYAIKPKKLTKTQLRTLQKVDGPLHMS